MNSEKKQFEIELRKNGIYELQRICEHVSMWEGTTTARQLMWKKILNNLNSYNVIIIIPVIKCEWRWRMCGRRGGEAASSPHIICARSPVPVHLLTYYLHLHGYSCNRIRQKVRVGWCCDKDGVWKFSTLELCLRFIPLFVSAVLFFSFISDCLQTYSISFSHTSFESHSRIYILIGCVSCICVNSSSRFAYTEWKRASMWLQLSDE